MHLLNYMVWLHLKENGRIQPAMLLDVISHTPGTTIRFIPINDIVDIKVVPRLSQWSFDTSIMYKSLLLHPSQLEYKNRLIILYMRIE